MSIPEKETHPLDDPKFCDNDASMWSLAEPEPPLGEDGSGDEDE